METATNTLLLALGIVFLGVAHNLTWTANRDAADVPPARVPAYLRLRSVYYAALTLAVVSFFALMAHLAVRQVVPLGPEATVVASLLAAALAVFAAVFVALAVHDARVRRG